MAAFHRWQHFTDGSISPMAAFQKIFHSRTLTNLEINTFLLMYPLKAVLVPSRMVVLTFCSEERSWGRGTKRHQNTYNIY
jgi:hypothetical protein